MRKAAFLLRGLLYAGGTLRCPCCGWRIRAFLDKSAILRTSPTGYCPRCNSKARHRRQWLYLRDATDLFAQPGRVLEVGPWWSLSRRLRALKGIDFVGVDIEAAGEHVTVVGDACSLPFATNSFRVALCTHVLEHVVHDRAAMKELYRVLEPGGWAVASAPIRLDRTTDEDPAVTDPAERERRFGERGHLRYYGADLGDRLTAAGFGWTLDMPDAIPEPVRRRHGLRTDEILFHCTKTAPEA